MRRIFVLLLSTAGILIFSLPALAQSCSLCYTQAASASAKLIQALKSGILVLLITPMFLSAGILYMAYSKRNKFASGSEDSTEDS
jgi:hypothetical protein